MLEYIYLLNFQKHKDYTYTFTDKTNYITGVNGWGKSTILRAIMWVACNIGDSKSFIRTYEDDGAICTSKEVSAEIGVDGHIVKRVYSSSVNAYYVDGLKITGFGKTVPEEVENIFRMSSLNYSEQFSSLFLLNDSGNSLATELGEVASLEEMEELSDSVNASIRAKASEVQSIEESLKESDKKIEAVGNLPYELEGMDSEIVKMMNEYKERENEICELKNFCEILTKKKDLSYLQDTIDSVEPDVELFNEDAYLAELIHISTKLKELPAIPSTVLEGLDLYINMSDFEMEDIDELKTMADSWRKIDMENQRDTQELEEINKQLDEFKVCPYCSSDLSKENHSCQS